MKTIMVNRMKMNNLGMKIQLHITSNHRINKMLKITTKIDIFKIVLSQFLKCLTLPRNVATDITLY